MKTLDELTTVDDAAREAKARYDSLKERIGFMCLWECHNRDMLPQTETCFGFASMRVVQPELDARDAEIKALREALAFYADRENWSCAITRGVGNLWAFQPKVAPQDLCTRYGIGGFDHGWEAAENALRTRGENGGDE